MKKTAIHIRLRGDVLDKLEAEANAQYRTLSNLVEKIILDKYGARQPAKSKPKKHLNGQAPKPVQAAVVR